MPQEFDFENLRYCLDNFEAEHIFIRDCGGYEPNGSYRMQGKQKVREDLQGRVLDFCRDEKSLYFTIDGEDIFHFTLEDYGKDERDKGFSVAYERFYDDGKMVMLPRGFNPDATNLPEPRTSTLRHILDRHLLEITFKGKIPLEFHSWMQEPHFAYWNVKKTHTIQLAIRKQEQEYAEDC